MMGDTARFLWIQLKRLGGLNPSTPTATQEGQVRYDRDGDVDGAAYVARHLAGGTYEWAPVQLEAPPAPAAHRPTLFARNSTDSSIAVTSTLADVLTTTIGPLVSGVDYDIELNVTMRGSVDTTGFVRAYARIGSGSSVIGTRTGTVGGERTIEATSTDSRTGTGSSVTLAARSDMSTSTGSVTGVHMRARAIPRS